MDLIYPICLILLQISHLQKFALLSVNYNVLYKNSLFHFTAFYSIVTALSFPGSRGLLCNVLLPSGWILAPRFLRVRAARWKGSGAAPARASRAICAVFRLATGLAAAARAGFGALREAD